MIYLNYTNFDSETQERLISISKKEVHQRYGKELISYAHKYQINYDQLLEEKAILNLYNYDFVFKM